MYQPKPGHMKYLDLINDIDRGLVKIPQFQREFVWSKKQSAGLIDSILKGYPIGTFILWKTKETLRSVRSIGRIDLPESIEGDFVNYVLDGQQRMTSLFASLKGVVIKRDEKKYEDFSEIYIDLEANDDDDIVIINIDEKKEGSYIKLTELIYGRLTVLVGKYDSKYHEKLDIYLERIKTYEFSTITVSDAPIDVATEIFTRINVGGKDLSVFEIMCAKTYDQSRGFDLSEKYDELICRLETVNYETISNSTVLQAVAVCLVKECNKKHVLKLDRNQVIDNWDEIINAFEHAVDYIRSFYRIPVSQLLPYKALLIPFTYFFYKNKEKPFGDMQKYLQDYFWRVVLNSRFSGSLETKVAQDIKKVIDKILKGEKPIYDDIVNISEEHLSKNGGFSVGRAYIKGMLCILTAKQPQSFADGSLVNIDNSWLKIASSKNYHHFFPKAYLRRMGEEDSYINHIANITIVDGFLNKGKISDKAPSVYMTTFSKINNNIEETMKTHLINDLNSFGVYDDDYKKFFNNRIKAFKKELESRLILQSDDIL